MKKFVFILLFVAPGVSFASVSINEIMYDVEGTDTKREWFEVVNNGEDSINLSNWKFFENNSNHSLQLFQGNEMLGPGAFAIVADSPDTFLTDWPNFSGNLFDSSWSSFSNNSESFGLKNEDGDLINEVTYTSADGANGDGNSLQLISGSFLPASPTPGAENQSSASTDDSLSGEQEESSLNSAEDTSDLPKSTFGIPDRVIVGEEVKFKPEIFDSRGESLFRVLFEWSFGDGSTREDWYKKDFSHIYQFPGTYVVYLDIYINGKKNEPDYTFRQTLQVVSSNVALTFVDQGLLIKNKSMYELDLGGWSLTGNTNNFFVIPKNTIVLPGKEITIPFGVLGQSFLEEVFLKNEIGDSVASITVKPSVAVVPQVKQKIVYIPQVSLKEEPTVSVSQESGVLESGSSQVASAVRGVDSSSEKKNLWILIYAGLVVAVLGGISYMYFRNEDDFIDEINDVDEYTIE